MLKFLLSLIIIYYCLKLLVRFIAPFLLKNIIFKVQKDMNKRNKTTNYRKHRNGDTEVSYTKNQNIDPGGEYVDFEDLNDEK